MEDNKKYPRFISNKPCGVDKFVGKSQDRLTNAIAEHIKEVDSDNEPQKTRIIGLEGSWGSGKSNVIEQLRKLIEDHYYIFIYDAWGHQEDLQRRSFLEKLTTELIENDILIGDTTIETKDGNSKSVSWKEKKNYLLARKTAIETDVRPKLNNAFVVVFLATMFTPLFVTIANCDIIQHSHCYWWISIILVLILPIAEALYLYWKNRKRENGIKETLNDIVTIYSGKVRNEVEYRTISEKEPSVVDFRKWMKDVSDSIGKEDKEDKKEKKKLIVVYDNMDRLPAEKVKELWASIHTFFSEDGFDNIWAIIPFDKEHLSCAFGEADEKEKLTNLFISKTFPVVYRVTPPVISDYKEIFNSFFEEAFGNTQQKSKDEINRIFRLENPNATVRDIIEYINQLVALKKVWNDEIDLLYIAIFKLKESAILSDPVNNILGGNYLDDDLLKIVFNNEELQKNISALVYGVDIENAEQIPMSNYLDRCFESGNRKDINKYANSKNFILILKDKINNYDDVRLDRIIQSISGLDVSKLPESDQKEITSCWNILAKRKMKLGLTKQEFDRSYERLLQYSECKQKIIEYLCRQIQSFGKFNGRDYFNSLKKMDKFVADNSINIDISAILLDLEKEPNIFVDYVLCAKTEYLKYKLSANPTELSEYLSARVVDRPTDLDVLQYLKNDKDYNFDEVKDKIEATIQDQSLIGESNFKPLLYAYKILSDERPLDVQLNPTQRNAIWSAIGSKTDTLEYREIVAIQIANGTNVGGSFSDKQIEYIAEQMDYYANYGDLLTNNWNFPILNKVLKYMTENKIGKNLSLKGVLPQFFNIKNRIGVSESTFLSQLNKWEVQKDTITSENITQILPEPKFFQFSVEEKNNLTKYLNTEIVKSLANEQSDILSQQVKQSNSYWHTVIENLIDTEFLEILPDNLSKLGIQYLDNIAASQLGIPAKEDIIYKIIKKLDNRNTSAHIKDIIDKYCNGQYAINPNLFLFFEEYFREQGNLKGKAERATHKIIEPVISDEDCLKKILDKSDFYAEIINNAGNDATALKGIIKQKINSNNATADLIAFAQKIGIEKENKQ